MESYAPECSKISPTAKLVAYWRQYSDIPYAEEVAKLVKAEEVFKEFLGDATVSVESMAWFAPMIEARYKSMVHAIRKQNIKQVLELASGVSLRGLAMTTDPEMIYVETDLPGMSAEKKSIVQTISERERIPKRTNLFFSDVNVLNMKELEAAVLPFFEGRPIAVIHEGLFQYLSLDEKKVAATHIRILLNRFGGVWMTPDLNTKEDIQRWHHTDSMKAMTDRIKNTTERDFQESSFENDTHIQEFFHKLGFDFTEFSQMDGDFELSSLKSLKLSDEILSPFKNHLKVWCLRSKT